MPSYAPLVVLWCLVHIHMFHSGQALKTSPLGNEIALRRRQTTETLSKLTASAEGKAKAAREGLRSVANQLHGHNTAELRERLKEKRSSNSAMRRSTSQDCAAFETEVLSAYIDSYSDDCGLGAFESLNRMMVLDLLANFSPPTKPADQTWNDVLGPFCSYSGAASASSCGETGFYARIRAAVPVYSAAGVIDDQCSWSNDVSLDETPLQVLSQIIEVYDLCLKDDDSGDYCAPSYWETLGTFVQFDSAENPDEFLAAFIPQFCTVCTEKVFQEKAVRAQGYDGEVFALQNGLLCSQVLGEYCYLDLSRIEQAASAAEEASIWCEGLCMPIIAAKWGAIDSLNGDSRTIHKKALRATYCAIRIPTEASQLTQSELENFPTLVANTPANQRCYEFMNVNETTELELTLENVFASCDSPPICGADSGYGTGDCSQDISEYDAWKDNGFGFPPVYDGSDDGVNCNVGCVTAFRTWFATWQCCAIDFLQNAVALRELNNPTQQKEDFFNWFLQKIPIVFGDRQLWRCGLESYVVFFYWLFGGANPDVIGGKVGMCGGLGQYDVEATLTLDNLLYSQYSTDKSTFNSWIIDGIEDDTAALSGAPTSITITDDSQATTNGTQVEVKVEVDTWMDRQTVIQALSSYEFDLDAFESENRRSGAGGQQDIFMLKVSQASSSTRLDPFAMVRATVSDVRVTTKPFLPSWDGTVFKHASVATPCNETRSWKEIGALKKDKRAFTGGLGRLIIPDHYEVWVCLMDHPCTTAMVASYPGDPEEPLTGGVLRPANSTDLMCFTYHEESNHFKPWGFNSQLHFVREAKLESLVTQ